MRNILLFDSNSEFTDLVRTAAHSMTPPAQVFTANSAGAGLGSADPAKFDLFILQHAAEDADWKKVHQLRKVCERIPILVVLKPEAEKSASEALQNGASDVAIESPSASVLLPLAIERCLERVSLQKNAARLECELKSCESARQTKSEFLSHITHDLRTPLVSLRIYAQFLASGRLGPLAPIQKEKVEAIYRNAERLTRCIESIQRYQRLEAPDMHLVPADFDLCACLGEAISGFMPQCMEKGITLGQSWPQEPVTVHADRELLLEVVKDLLDNAVQFTQSKGSISVNVVQQSDRRVSVSITDSGCGITPEKLKTLFDGECKAGQTTCGSGYGLGLRMVRRILEAHKSSLDVDSAPGGGTRVRFTLPPALAMRTSRAFGETEYGRRRVVLLVDDDEDNLVSTRSVLEYAGYEVLGAGGVEEARAQLDEGHVDVVLMDIALRGGDGLETLNTLKRNAATSSLPVVMVSARADDAVRVRAAQMGAAGFVVKPFIPAKLLRELDTVMEARATA